MPSGGEALAPMEVDTPDARRRASRSSTAGSGTGVRRAFSLRGSLGEMFGVNQVSFLNAPMTPVQMAQWAIPKSLIFTLLLVSLFIAACETLLTDEQRRFIVQKHVHDIPDKQDCEMRCRYLEDGVGICSTVRFKMSNHTVELPPGAYALSIISEDDVTVYDGSGMVGYLAYFYCNSDENWFVDYDKDTHKFIGKGDVPPEITASLTNNTVPESCTVQLLMQDTDCKFDFKPPRWKAYLVVLLLASAVTLIIEDIPAEVCLLSVCWILHIVGVMDRNSAFGGFANKSVLALGLLFPIAAAIDDTGVLDVLISAVLGTPKSFAMALMRMMPAVAFLSAFLSNTAVVAAMIPAIAAWSRRLGMSPSKLMMPLSFASQLGGSWTLVGSSHCLIAASSTQSIYPREGGMGFWSLTPVAFLLTITTTIVIIVLAPFTLKGSAEKAGSEDDVGLEAERQDVFSVLFIVGKGSSVRGKQLDETGIDRIPGVTKVDRMGGPAYEGTPLGPGDEVVCKCTAEGCVALRQIGGFMVANHAETNALGIFRRKRHVYEATLHAKSPLLYGQVQARTLKKEYGACLLSVRASTARQFLTSTDEARLSPGDIVLLEADERWVNSAQWSESFTLVRMLPKSSPPRNTQREDAPRAIAVCLGMVILISLVTAKVVNLLAGGGILVIFYLLIQALSVQQVYSSIKAPVLLVIAGAFGLSQAIKQSGLATFISLLLLDATAGCPICVYIAIYGLAFGLSMFINNSATIAIVASMLPSIAESNPDLSVRAITWILVYGAGSCFTTPLGYQTNMMVMPEGHYTFLDFMKFGSIVQALHGVTCITFVLMADKVLPDFF